MELHIQIPIVIILLQISLLIGWITTRISVWFPVRVERMELENQQFSLENSMMKVRSTNEQIEFIETVVLRNAKYAMVGLVQNSRKVKNINKTILTNTIDETIRMTLDELNSSGLLDNKHQLYSKDALAKVVSDHSVYCCRELFKSLIGVAYDDAIEQQEMND